MLIQWCLKGIPFCPGFGDKEAQAVLAGEGLRARWLHTNPDPIRELPLRSGSELSQAALDAHVNAYATVPNTPYLSLTAGCRERDTTRRGTLTYPALKTALSFATNRGTTVGYVFRLWVLVAPKPAPELPGFGEEVRSLLTSPQFATFHHEGEVAAKLYVPSRQPCVRRRRWHVAAPWGTKTTKTARCLTFRRHV